MPKLHSPLLLIAALFAANAFAQAPNSLPGGSAMSEQQRRINETMNQLNLSQPEIQAQGAANAVTSNAVNQLIDPQRKGAVTKEDFELLANPQKKPATPAAPRADLMVFVSLSMPESMLENYAAQAKKHNAVLMLRGFVDEKLSQTRKTLQRLNKSGAPWEINPEAFKHFKIDKVPAVVMANADSGSITEDGCAKPETYSVVYGDMSMLSALDKISLRGQPSIAGLAKERILADRRSKN